MRGEFNLRGSYMGARSRFRSIGRFFGDHTTKIVILTAIVMGVIGLSAQSARASHLTLNESDFSAAAAVVAEVNLGDDTADILWGKNMDTPLRPASMSKTMTMLLFLEYTSDNPAEIVTVYPRNAAIGGTTANLTAGAQFRADQILYGLMLPSGNDAAHALADHIGRNYLGGDDQGGANDAIALFVEKMNERAAQLGMTNTNYMNPHGLDENGHVTTARDMLIVTKALMKHPFAMEIMGTDYHYGFTVANPNINPPYSGYRWVNTNHALCEYPGTIGGKTGTTPLAKQNVMVITERGGKTLVSVVMNAGSGMNDPIPHRYMETYLLQNYGYDQLGIDAEATSWCNEDETAIEYTGGWQRSSYRGATHPQPIHIDGHTMYGWPGLSAEFTFTGRGVEWFSYRSDTQGIAEVYIDGVLVETVDLYAPVPIPATRSNPVFAKFNLPEGEHTLKIVPINRVPGANVNGNWVHVDSFRVTGGLVIPDTTAPTITNVSSGMPDETSATITWLTNESATSRVEYGTTLGYGETTVLDANLVTSHSVDFSGLQPDTTYHYRVISTDANGNEAISSDYTFKTPAPSPIEDNDGVDASVEDGAPNGGDGNNDGILDSEQSNVVSLVSLISNNYVTLAVDATCSLSSVSISGESTHSTKDTGYEYREGFVNFTATGCADSKANVQLYYHGVTNDNFVARKFDSNKNTYFTIEDANISILSGPLSGVLVSYKVIDNGVLDMDDAMGVIVDPVGLGVPLSGTQGAPNTGLKRLGVLPTTGMIVSGLLLSVIGIRKYRQAQ